MGLSKVSENGLASFSWHSRSKLFARWWVSKPVFIDFGPDFGIWRVLRFDPTQKRGVVAYIQGKAGRMDHQRHHRF